jgi:methyl-accepting chemotaxis protein
MKMNLSIGQRLALGFGAVIALTLVIGAYAFRGISNISKENKKQQIIFQTSRTFTEMENAALGYLSSANEKNLAEVSSSYNKGVKLHEELKPMVTQTNQGMINMIRKNFDDFNLSFQEVVAAMVIKTNSLKAIDQMSDRALGIAKQIMGGEVNAGVQQFLGIRLMEKQYMLAREQKVYDDWLSTIDANIGLANYLKIAEISFALEQYKKSFLDYVHADKNHIELEAKQKQLAQISNSAFEQGIALSTELMNRTVSNAITVITAIFAIILVLGVFIAYRISNTLTSGVNQVVKMAQDIAGGDLTQSTNNELYRRKDQIGVLVRAMHDMKENIKEIVANIQQEADSIVAAGMQMSGASQQMSQGANEQASSTEEITSSVEEMVSSIQQNADNSREADKISLIGVKGIEQGSQASLVAVESMKKIVDKITFVNEIARQTNILALNAAVEAARAGDHGRGFAVVADEVRKLAERSRVAAQEIDQISKNGMKVAEDAGHILKNLVPEVKRTAQLVQEIAASSSEQNTGALQINNAIQQLNTVTQQTASTSEELSGSAEQLAQQAQRLKEMVGYFRLEANERKQFRNEESKSRLYAPKTSIVSSLAASNFESVELQ